MEVMRVRVGASHLDHTIYMWIFKISEIFTTYAQIKWFLEQTTNVVNTILSVLYFV